MCGRYTYYSSDEIIHDYASLVTLESPQISLLLNMPDNFNVFPGSTMPVILRGKHSYTIDLMTWGLVPSWSKEPHTALKLINARKEGLFEKPIWKKLVAHNRCIVPARGFYEWKRSKDLKQAYYIAPTKSAVFSFAGLYDIWTDEKGNKLKTYTIITTMPNKAMSTIHNRMPALLSKQSIDVWLGPTEISQELAYDLLQPIQSSALKIVKVTNEVNNPKNNSKTLIYPLNESI